MRSNDRDVALLLGEAQAWQWQAMRVAFRRSVCQPTESCGKIIRTKPAMNLRVGIPTLWDETYIVFDGIRLGFCPAATKSHGRSIYWKYLHQGTMAARAVVSAYTMAIPGILYE